MMWSGDPQYSQWALNPSTYQNVAHEEVDWAALAQQWIQMKETHPSDQIPPAPPPPAIGDKSDSGDKKKDSELEGGEAPMDMDTKEDNSNSSNTQSGDANTWNTWPNWQQWGWNWSATGGMVPPGGVPPPNQSLVQGKGTTSTSAMTVPPYGYPHNSQAYTSGTGVYDYNHAGGSDQYSQYKDGRGMDQSQHVRRGSEVMASGYWTSGGPADTGGVPPGPGPSPFIRHNRHDWRRNNRSHDRLRTSEKSDDEEDTTTVLDAAKRRQLPAWIREGLEKMEREKQKKIDRERQIKEREAYLQKKREDEEHAMSELEKNAGQPMIPKKSKFESDSEESGRGDSPTPSQSSLKRKSRFRNADSPNSSPRHPAARFPSTEPEPVKSREELMQEVMLKVRRTLTEILLEVTTEEMETVAHEVLSRAKAKAPAMQLRKTQALASLTGKLGLGMYGDSEDSDSGDDGPGENSPGRANGADSDEELRDVIQRRKIDFIKTEREIEARIQEEEERDKERERRLMGEESDESDGEERQVENQTDTKHLVQKGSEEEDDDKKLKILHLQDNIKHEDKLQNSTIRDHFTTPPSVRKSDIKLERTEKLDRKSLNQKKSSVSSDENDDSSSKSNSYSSSSSDSSSTSRSSSSTSRRSSKKSSKSSRSMGGSRRSEKKKSGDSRRKRSRSLSRDSEDFKKSDKHRDRKRDSDKDRRGRDKRDRHRSRSRSMSDASRSRDGHDRRKSKDHRHSSRHESDSGSRKSRDSDRRSSNSSNKPRAYRHDRESPSPSRKSKKMSRDKRRSRHSSGSSSPSSSKRRDSRRGEKRGRYSRSRSNSISSSKKSRRRRRSSSSSRSTQSFERSLGKKSGHSRND